MPAPSRLRRTPSRKKQSDLPSGISGPIVRQRAGSRVRDCSFAVTLPRFGETPLARSVYIGTENTYTVERYQEALERAVALREKAEVAYQRAATKERRAQAVTLKAQMSGLLGKG